MARGRKTTVDAVTGELVPTGKRVPAPLRALVRATDAKTDPLKWVMKQIPGGTRAVLALLRLSDDPEAVRVIQAWKRIASPNDATRGIPLHEVLEHADLTPRDFVGVVSRVAFDFNVNLGQSIAAMHYPEMMKVSMQRAQEATATDERKIHFQASGYLPTSRGIQIGIRNTNAVAVPDDAPPAPGRPASFDRTARQVVRDLPPAK
jgi:hypothetical protein